MRNERDDNNHLLTMDAAQAVFLCPGEAAPVSRVVHLARLNAGWHGCRNCQWNTDRDAFRVSEQVVDDPELTALASSTTDDIGKDGPAGRGPVSRGPVSRGRTIRRTRCGVRGRYLNDLDRFTAAQIATVYAIHIRRRFTQTTPQTTPQSTPHTTSAQEPGRPADGDESLVISSSPPVTIVLGFDGRHGSPDIFAGVLEAVRQSGVNVIDAGRGSFASLLHVCRNTPDAAALMIATGAGGRSGDVGLDVFLRDGQTVAVPWSDYGITACRSQSVHDSADASVQSPAIQEKLNQIRTQRVESGDGGETFLTMPGQFDTRRVQGNHYRTGRRCGARRTTASEHAYRDWLRKWWPEQCRVSASILVHDVLTRERLEWLAGERELCLHIEFGGSSDDMQKVQFTAGIAEDDRFLELTGSRGRTLAAAEVADWINSSGRPTKAQVTAHVAPEENRLLLVDVATPESGRQHQVISDGLATLGFILALQQDGRNPLPA